MRKIAIVSPDSTGKTTTAINLAHGLALCGKKVLVVDCNVRRDVGFVFRLSVEKALGHLLLHGKADIVEARSNLFVVDSGGRRLTDAEAALARVANRERRLERALKNLKGCDVVLCDCSRAVSLINVNAVTFADQVIIPVSMDRIAPAAARAATELVREIDASSSTTTQLLGYLPTFHDERARVCNANLDALRERFGREVFETVIRSSSSLREAPSYHKTIFEYSPKSGGAYDYYQLTEEFLAGEAP